MSIESTSPNDADGRPPKVYESESNWWGFLPEFGQALSQNQAAIRPCLRDLL